MSLWHVCPHSVRHHAGNRNLDRNHVKSEPTFVFPAGIDPLSFITLNPDNTVVITCQVFEMGQVSYTAAATLAGDELDAEWSQLRVVPAPLGQQYGNPLFGGGQGTGGQLAPTGRS
ncbi:MAG: hypothetical protein LH616_15900 [Ilumatobacteraceae bacterium]|nr:hypothetical protein [Ilumatobacteraceae bacterium]